MFCMCICADSSEEGAYIWTDTDEISILICEVSARIWAKLWTELEKVNKLG